MSRKAAKFLKSLTARTQNSRKQAVSEEKIHQKCARACIHRRRASFLVEWQLKIAIAKQFNKMKTIALFFCIAALNSSLIAQPVTYVSLYPSGYFQNGNSYPFTSQDRIQEILPTSIFNGADTSLPITQLAYKISVGGSSGGSLVLNNVKIQLSTSPSTIANASTVFANNIGADMVTVFDGSLTFANPGSVDLTTTPFNMVFDLSTPFFYDPTKGNLCLDITYSGASSPVSTASGPWGPTTPVGPVIYARRDYGLVAASTSGTLDYLAPDVRFTFGAVPEPSTFIFAGMALCFGMVAMKRTGK